MKSPRSQPKPRVGLRDIASAAGVCLMTVSLSLRGSPKISAATRDRIQHLADEMGYRPDPEISRLMRHLRSSRTSQGKVGLVIVDFYPTSDFAENSYNQRIRQGAIRRATELGESARRCVCERVPDSRDGEGAIRDGISSDGGASGTSRSRDRHGS